jgi:hypothetical protein
MKKDFTKSWTEIDMLAMDAAIDCFISKYIGDEIIYLDPLVGQEPRDSQEPKAIPQK